MSTGDSQIGLNSNLHKQDLSNLDVSNLTPLSPEVISRQATINIGTIGHVAHGKSTVVKAISGVQTVRFKNELERNITIKLERLSKERLVSLLESPTLLREYEKRVETCVNLIAQKRHENKLTHSPPSTRFGQPLKMSRNNNSYDSVVQRFHSIRNMSSSPSSGYETQTDNASSVCSRESSLENLKDTSNNKMTRKRAKSLSSSLNLQSPSGVTKKVVVADLKRRNSLYVSKSSSKEGKKTPIKMKSSSNSSTIKKAPKGEYIVEHIDCVETINSRAVFFVKWLNYSKEENTWESLENLKDCVALEHFLEDRTAFFEITIAAISAELENEIQRDGLTYDADKLTLSLLDSFDPLELKVDLLLLAQFRDAKSRSQREPEKIRKRVIDMMLIKPYYYMRKRQKMDLNDWQRRVNMIEHAAPIKIENNIDLDVPDTNFSYILESFAGKDIAINTTIDPIPPIGCKCANGYCLPTTKCCARMADTFFAYDKTSRLRIRTGEAIYECNSKCSCDLTCRNRVIQHGRKTDLCIFKTSNGCGWGVRTERMLKKGEYVCEYVGEIITSDEANERGKRYDDIGRTYLFDLDYNTNMESVYTIDAALFGNVSHFINHSCDPNLAVFPFWINNLDVNMPRLAFFTLRTIKAGEELNFDYVRPSATQNTENNDMENSEMDNNDYQNLSTAKKVTCRCGAENCRKVLF